MPAMTPAAPDLTDLDAHGAAVLPALLSPAECATMIALWGDSARFRKEVVMARHGYGSGTYRYFDYPLPEPVARLRAALYPPLAQVANRWADRLGSGETYPEEHEAYLERCRALGQAKATPLILRYGPGDWNALHQDIYGEGVFPLQVVVLLSAPGRDFGGGEFVLSEQRPRMQSRPEVVQLEQGDAVVFPVRERPVPGRRGYRKVQLRHGVSRVRQGERWTLGIIFHDAA
ncbi:MAG: 2OG-Fe(II) oxygenase [Novosphingobium sp.]